jgi:hypothetical protein
MDDDRPQASFSLTALGAFIAWFFAFLFHLGDPWQALMEATKIAFVLAVVGAAFLSVAHLRRGASIWVRRARSPLRD